LANEAGAGCVSRASSVADYTWVSKSSPASIGGSVTRLAAYWYVDITSNQIIFAFFTASVNNLTTVAGTRVVCLPSETGISCHEEFAPADFTAFNVNSGNYVGAFSIRPIFYATSGGTGLWYQGAGDYTNVSDTTFTLAANGIDSFTADITAAGGLSILQLAQSLGGNANVMTA